MSALCAPSDTCTVLTGPPPTPPRVFAPLRPSPPAPEQGTSTAPTSAPGTAPGAQPSPVPASSGAQVTAVVPRLGVPPAPAPAPATSLPPTSPPATTSTGQPPVPSLARTGLDAGPVLLLALLLVLLGALALRAAIARPAPPLES